MDTATRPGIKCDLDAGCPHKAQKLLITRDRRTGEVTIDFACVPHAIAHQQALGEAKQQAEFRDWQYPQSE